MRTKQFVHAAGAVAVCVAVGLAGMLISSTRGIAQNGGGDEESKIQQGFAIAPVPLNLVGKNRALVGLGSYLVNGDGDCNGCHSAGPPPTEFTGNGNPYLLPPIFSGKKTVNPMTYLGGNRNFGPLVPGSANIISRNLTPDKTGMPEGGRPFSEFLQIIRTGADLDKLHPTCTGAPNAGCVPFPFNGALLQIMPWPAFQNMTDRDIQAIYEYLSAIPCITGPPAPDPRHNDCP